ncbi:MAG: hypothetical protein R6V31_02500 [Halohasta sp.]
MKRLLMVGVVLGVVGIVVGSLFFAGGGVNPDRPAEDAPGVLLHVDPVDNSEDVDGSVIEYNNLTANQQAVFERAVDDDFTEIPDDTNASVWYDSGAVNYQNKTYHVFVSEP